MLEVAKEAAEAARRRLFLCGGLKDLGEERENVDGLLGDAEEAVDAVDGPLERAELPEAMREAAAADEVVDEVVEDSSDAEALLRRLRGLEPEEGEDVCPVEVEKEAQLHRRRRRPSRQV